MAGIQTGIEMYDHFSGVLAGFMSSINLTISSIESMQSTLSTNIDVASIVGAREQIHQTTAAINAMDEAAQNMGAQHTNNPASNPSTPPQVTQWGSEALEVFTNSGFDRWQQEVESANNMLNTLNSTQLQIQQTSSAMEIFSAGAVQDIAGVGQRMQAIQERIQQIEANPMNIGTDTSNAEMERLRTSLAQMIGQQNSLNAAVDRMDVNAANNAYLQLSRTIGSTEQYIRDNISAQNEFNQSIRDGTQNTHEATNEFQGWQKAIIVANQAINLVSNTLGQLGVMDISGAFDRIDTMEQFRRTVTIMTGDAGTANAALAQLRDTTLGTAYGLDVASSATQGFMTRGMSIGAATNQVRVWADAVSFYGAGTNEQLESVGDAIGNMYSKGTVEADQLDRLFDAGIGAAELYADTMGLTVSQVKEDLSSGAISAGVFIQTVSEALDNGMSSGAAKDAGATWAATFSNVEAAITRGWTDMITQLDAALATQGLPSAMEMVAMFGQVAENVLGGVADSMVMVVNTAIQIYDVMAGVGGFIVDNWSIIAPLILGAAAAMGVYAIAVNSAKIAEKAQAIWTGISTAARVIATATTWLFTSATLAQAGAQWRLNAALTACPLVWIIILIIALIAILAAVCAWIAKTTGIAQSGFGIICGAINVALQFFRNLGLTVANIALGIGSAISALGSNIMTAFHNAIVSVQSWWYGLLSDVMYVVDGICAALNKIPFIEFDYSGISSAAEEYANKSAALAGEKQEYKDLGEAFAQGMSTFDTFQDGWVQDAFAAGADWGDGVTDSVSGLFSFDTTSKEGKNIMGDVSSGLDMANESLSGISDTTGSIKESIDVSQEDLRYLRDIAEREEINRFTTAAITVEMSNQNNITNVNDLDGIMDGFTKKVIEAIEVVQEGV